MKRNHNIIFPLSQYRNISFLYLIVWCLYGFHWFDINQGNIIDSLSTIFLGFNLLVTFYCINKINRIYLPSFFNAITLLLLVFTIYGLIYIVGGDTVYASGQPVSKATYIIGIYRSYLPLYAFFYFTIKGYINNRTIIVYFLVLCFFCVLYDYYAYTNMFSNADFQQGFVNNMGYLFVSLFPFIFLFKNNVKLQVLSFLFISIITLIAMKRGAIMILFVLIIWSLYHLYKKSSFKVKLRIIACSSLLLMIFAWETYRVYQSNDFVKARIENTREGDSSGRDELYVKLWNHYENETNIIQIIFGSGAFYSYKIIGKEAHSDWFELLTSQGAFGVIVYGFFWISLFCYWKKIPKNRMEYYVCGAFFITQFIRSLISMSYTTVSTPATLVLGYSMATYAMDKINLKINKYEQNNRNNFAIPSR